jgi:hypothetical protein
LPKLSRRIHNILISVSYYSILGNSIIEQTEPRSKLVTVKLYVTKEEFAEFQKAAFFMHGQKVIRRPSVGAFVKAAGYKWFNEVNEKLAQIEAISERDKTLPKIPIEENRDAPNFGPVNL